MDRQNVQSSNIVSIGFDEDSEILQVEFKGGVVYEYFDVPEHIHEELMAAESVGSYFARVVKGNYSFNKVG